MWAVIFMDNTTCMFVYFLDAETYGQMFNAIKQGVQ